MSRTGSSPGRPRRWTTRRPARTQIGAMAARQGGPLHSRGELHGLVFVEGVCQGRDHHLGDPGGGLPVDRPGLRSERWRHDKEVRSTHGVNCTGSCSWKVYVKDGIITWETQEVDYPSTGPDSDRSDGGTTRRSAPLTG